jgi:hypothetical protein
MRTLKLVGALFSVLALTAFALAATASAAETLWEWLPGTTGTTFTGKSGSAKLQIKNAEKGTIICASSSVLAKEGEITGERTLGLAFIHFIKCTVAGNPVNSLGDEPGIILVHVELHNCLIEPGDAGILIKLLPLHLEIPATGLLISVQGSLIALVSPNKTKALTFTVLVAQKAGQQAITKCEGSKIEDKLETSLDGGEFIQSGEEAKEGSFTFEGEVQEVMV